MNDKTLAYVQTLIAHLTEGLKSTGTIAWHTYLNVVQTNCIINFIQILGFSVIAFLFSLFFRYLKLNSEKEQKDESVQVWRFFQYVCLIFSLLILFLGSLDGWNWVGIFNPQLYAAHEIVNKLSGN